jgi:hypothetical protein
MSNQLAMARAAQQRRPRPYTHPHTPPTLAPRAQVFPLFLNLVLRFPVGLSGLLILAIDLITEQGPAISLAYEPAEANVMERPPRDTHEDRLISASLLRYSYLVAGEQQAAAAGAAAAGAVGGRPPACTAGAPQLAAAPQPAPITASPRSPLAPPHQHHHTNTTPQHTHPHHTRTAQACGRPSCA